jgi:CBS domain-containing protein
MQTVRQLLDAKSQQAMISVAPDFTVYQALQLMAEKDIGAVLVMENGEVAGIFSERDYARRIVLLGRTSVTTAVREIMTRKVMYVRPDNTLEECMALMTERHIRHLPVMEDGLVIGMLSIGDLVRSQIAAQQLVIDQLLLYIQSA